MSHQLRDYMHQFASARERIVALTEGLDTETFNASLASGGWSIAEIVEHLCIIGEMLLPRIDVAIDETREGGWYGDGPYTYPPFSRLFLRSVGPLPPSKRGKTKAPRIYKPSASRHELNDLTARFIALQDKLIERCRNAEGLNLRRVAIASPVTPLIRVRLGAWFEALALHQLRHFQQIEDVRSQLRVGSMEADRSTVG